MIFGFGYGLIANSFKYFTITSSLWVLFILALMGTLLIYILEVIHELVFPQIWLGFLFLALVWMAFAKFGSIVSKRLYKDATTQQRNDEISKRTHNQEKKE